VLQLIELGQTVHIVDFAPKISSDEYLSIHDDFQQKSFTAFRDKISGLHLIETSFTSNWRYVSAVPHLKRILNSIKPDVLLTLYGGGFATLAYLSFFRPFVVYVVGSDVLLAKGLRRQFCRLALNAASAVFANGKFLAEKTREIAAKAKVCSLLLGIDFGRWTQNTYPPEPIRIICSRGFMPVYNNAYLIHGLALMADNMPDFRVIFVSNGPLLNDVRALADNLLPHAVRQKVDFLGGVSDQTLINLLKQSHIYVSLSRSDGTSISLLEALSCGLFPVLSDIPQNREWIDPLTNNGYLVPLDEPAQLAETLTKAILHTTMRKEAAVTNRHLMEVNADSHRNMSVLLTEMETILHGNTK
jgi:glycosyltransferase involved in cell wall biosynthesis